MAYRNVEYLTRLMGALGFFESAIREQIPSDLLVQTRAPIRTVGPESREHEGVLARFRREVCSNSSVMILMFLYQFEKYLRHDPNLFLETYRDVLDAKRLAQIEDRFPMLDQTTVSAIFDFVSDTTVVNRLEDLSRIGLVSRSRSLPPSPKRISITEKGIEVIESAIAQGSEQLAPLFHPGGRPGPSAPFPEDKPGDL